MLDIRLEVPVKDMNGINGKKYLPNAKYFSNTYLLLAVYNVFCFLQGSEEDKVLQKVGNWHVS